MRSYKHFLTRCLVFAGLCALPLSSSSYSTEPAAPFVWEQIAPDQSVAAMTSRLPLQAPLTDTHGRTLTLQQVLSGRPAVLVFMDDACATDCTTPLRLVTQTMERAGQSDLFSSPLSQYRRIVVSNRPAEPQQAAAISPVQGALAGHQSWQFLWAPTASTIAQLQIQAGLNAGSQPATTSGLVFLSAEGEVVSRVLTDDLSPPAVEQALKLAEESQQPHLLTGSLVQAIGAIKQYGQYYPAVPMLAKMLGVLALILLVWGRCRPARSQLGGQTLNAQPR